MHGCGCGLVVGGDGFDLDEGVLREGLDGETGAGGRGIDRKV